MKPRGPIAMKDICLKSILNSKFCEISFAHNNYFCHPIILRFCSEHGSFAAMLCAKFQNDWTTEEWLTGKKVFAKFEHKTDLWWIFCVVMEGTPAVSYRSVPWTWVMFVDTECDMWLVLSFLAAQVGLKDTARNAQRGAQAVRVCLL